MNKTTNFEFNLPEGSDKVLVSILNENMDKLDEIFADIYSKLPASPIVINAQDGTAMTDPVGAEITAACGQLDYSVGFTTGDSYDLKFELNGEVLGETTESIIDYTYNGNTYKTLYNNYIIDNAEVIGVIHNESTGMYEPMLQPTNGKTAWWVPEQVVDGQIQNFVITVTKSNS